MSGEYSLSTLGDLRLAGPNGAVLSGRRKELVLLAYIARRAPKAVSRDELAALLWGERDEDKARQSLRHALHQLRRALGDAIDTTGDDVKATDAIAVDASLLEADIANGRLSDAVERWGGDFLRGAEDAGGEEYAAWLERERERLRRTIVSAFSKLVDEARHRGPPDELRWARRWTDLFPLDEAAHVALIDALRRSGDADEARSVHSSFVARLRSELDVAPSLELIRAGEELSHAARKERARRPGAAAIVMPELIGRGAAILNSLYDLWAQVRSDGSFAVVEGSDGSGKTRLRAELIRRIRDAGAPSLVLDAAARAADDEDPWSALRRAMQALIDSSALEDAPNKALVELAPLLPELRRRFPHLAESPVRAERIDPAVRDVLRVVGARTPILLVIDDHELSDAATHELLSRLAASVPRGVLLLLTISTDTERGRRRATQLAEIGGARRFKIPLLSRDEIGALVDAMLEVTPSDRAALIDRLADRAGGNPQHTIAVVSELAGDGTLALGERGVWQFAEQTHSTNLGNPQTDVRDKSSGERGPPRDKPVRSPRSRWIAAGVLAASVIAVAFSLVRGGASSDTVVDDRLPPRVAVLDLELVGGDTVDRYLASGLAEEINSTLSRFETLRIKSRGSVRTARASGVVDPVTLGRTLQVDYLVEGSLRRIDSTFKVAVRLTKASDGFQVWSKDFDARTTALPVLHDRIAREVASRIGGRLTTADASGRMPTKDAQAYEHFLRGNYYLGRRTPPMTEQAIAQYQLALARDTMFVAARARIAYAYALMLDWGWPYARKSPEQLHHEGLRLAEAAIQLDSLSPDAWMAKAYLLASADPVRMSGAAEAFERAIVLDPKNTEAIHQYAQVHEATGAWDKAMDAMRRTLLLEPDRALPFVAMASIEWKRGRPDEARRLYDSALVVDPGASYVLSARALLRVHRGDVAGGLEDAETAVHVEDGYSIPPHSVLAIALARSGSMVRARLEVDRALSEIPDPSAPSPTDARFIASALMAVGRREDAIHLLERARPRGAWLWFYALAPDFDPVRNDPRFEQIMREAHPPDLPQPTLGKAESK
jgi:DNA-binding SARP family transcriptional activator/TolB-like protein